MMSQQETVRLTKKHEIVKRLESECKPLRVVGRSRSFIPDEAWYVFAGIQNIRTTDLRLVKKGRKKEVAEDVREIEAMRFIEYHGWGNIGQVYFPVNSVESFEDDLILFNSDSMSRYGGLVQYKSDEDYDEDCSLLERSGVLGDFNLLGDAE